MVCALGGGGAINGAATRRRRGRGGGGPSSVGAVERESPWHGARGGTRGYSIVVSPVPHNRDAGFDGGAAARDQ